MTYWRLRNPDSFLAAFHAAMRVGICDGYLILENPSEKAIRDYQRQWQLFMYCLREHPLHPLHKPAMELKFRVKVKYSTRHAQWQLLLTTRESLYTELLSIR